VGRFSYIAYLCREGDRDKLREEVSSMAKAMGRSSEDVADEFIYAFNNAEEHKNDPAYKVISETQQEAADHYQSKLE
tara:strand:+ start:5455 stop:5685 length:231 start_codon:yes stop_codon:yes gene_type:complete